jgi:hypothetical protein
MSACIVASLRTPGYLSNLGIALRTGFARTGQPADLDQAIITSGDAAVSRFRPRIGRNRDFRRP